MLMIFQEELWVKEMTGAEIFDLHGQPLRNQPLSQQIASIKAHGDVLLGVGSFADGCGLRLDSSGKVLSYFGPKKSDGFGIEDMMRTSGWLAFPQVENRCVLITRFDGLAWNVDANGNLGVPMDLKLGRGFVGNDFQSKMVLSDVCPDSQEGYFVIHYPETGGSGYLLHFSSAWKQDGTWDFPDGVRPGIVRVGPNGGLCLLEEQSSILYICKNPTNKN